MHDVMEETSLEQSTDDVLVHAWRAEQIERLGISRLVAEAVAGFVDWHDLARLVARGCPPVVALEIIR
jgi:hypothetical protein